MLKKLHLTFSVFLFFFLNISFLKADLLIPNNSILPAEVVKIQLIALMNNNKKNTGPLPNFKVMIKGNSYQMLINHISHTITEIGSSDNWAQFEVVILDKEKIYHKFNWQVEKFTLEGPLKDCWLTTMVSSPEPLGSSI